ncbi:peptidyl-tRNA hydrolase 2, mitochondrial-like [Dendronephthya gigantea]|uniref:peptidyl-tRNA hydrolase 2, mitochondrial-like n=1 Tax=Dendronephthya gigantea TaxID=151771 RepID=UPI001068E383|nr:peptidyl-tRNA hydrolase 2, mitochondrial-like [Dendronephthya gigantea]
MIETDAGVGLFFGISCGLCLGWVLRGRYHGVPSLKNLAEKIPTYSPGGHGDYKMVLVVRQDLGMGKGKIAAQCSHAAVGLYRQLIHSNSKVIKDWERSSCPKVVVKAPDEETLRELARKARGYGIETCLISDAGRTQIAPGSRTVLGIGPGPTDVVDQVTGHLKLC